MIRLPATDATMAMAAADGGDDAFEPTSESGSGWSDRVDLGTASGAAAAESSVLIASEDDRGTRRRDGRLVRPVRQPLPRERGTGAPPAAPPAGTANAALAVAPASGPAARRRQPLRLVPDHPRDLPRMPPGRLRPAGAARGPGGDRAARDPRRERRDAARVAVRQLAAVRLHRGVHVRGRRAAARPARAGAGARPRPPARAARRGGAPRAARRRGARRARARAAGADRGAGRRLGRPGARPAAAPGRPVRRRGRGARSRAGREGARPGRRGVAGGAGRRPAGGARPDRRESRAGSRPRTSGGTAMRWASLLPGECRMRSWPRPGTRSVRCSAGGHGATVRFSPGSRHVAGGCRSAWWRRRWSG